MQKGQYYILLLFLALGLSSCFTELDMTYSDFQKVKVGDNQDWKSKDFEDKNWLSYNSGVIPVDSTYWVRQQVDLGEIEARSGISMRLVAIGSYDVFWDGQYLGSNGQHGLDDNSRFREGNYVYFQHIPDSLATDGYHTIAMRTKNNQEGLYQHSYSLIGNSYDIHTTPLIVSLYMFLVAGVFFIVGIYFIITFFFDKKKEWSTLIFSLICFVFLGLLLLEY